ncbi:hypothetical protein CCAX7_38850 [Capsulimonas corticalis]|uniref:Amidohydrolase-related domain-containing protein n=1 Tax=Capsulimonas corticalis TaxID=2219043 RepID=A0A402D3W5_9BACT|nr:amidohydrolase family protein [Capsulimonas corticalis]BDI31834.1 hypothetical protein CCAX7_38850 [Capsulimonas corticalis]
MNYFDAHAYLADTALSHAMATPDAIAATLGRGGITGAALISGLAAQCDFITGNARLRQVLNPAAGIYGYVTLNSGYPEESQEEQRKHLGRREFVAAVMFGHDGRPVTLNDSREILNAQRRYTKPMAIHTPNAAAVHAAREIAVEFPSMKFILLGMGGESWHGAVAAAKQHLNIYLEISGSLDSDKITQAAAALTPRKLLFGSGLPYSDPQLTIGLVEDASALTAADRARIFSQNAVLLFNAQTDDE